MTEMPKCVCTRCGKVWIRTTEELPMTCANQKCRSPYWNKPRSRVTKKV